MKKFLLVAVIALFSFNYAHSQEGQWKLGGSLSFPVSDLGNASNFGFQFNGSYLFNIEGNLEAGPMASLQPYFGKEHVKGAWFLPIGGEARYNLNEFFVGTDLGLVMVLVLPLHGMMVGSSIVLKLAIIFRQLVLRLLFPIVVLAGKVVIMQPLTWE